MKSLKQYLAESEKTYSFRVRTVAEMSDEQLDKLEQHLARYNVESVSAPKTSIIQKSPTGFGNTGVPLGAIRVYNEGDVTDIEEELEDTAEPTGNSRLADADYSEAEKVDHKQHYGNEFVSNFVKNLPKSDLHKEYKV